MLYPPGVSWGKRMRADIKKKTLRRLKIIEGQVKGLSGMVAEEKYCVDIITQAGAVKEGLSAGEKLVLENHLSTHALHQLRAGQAKKAIDEIIKVYKLAGRT